VLRDSLLAWAHFLTIFALVGVLVAELVLYRSRMDLARLGQLARIDSAYGIIAGLVIVTGLGRVFLGIKGPAFYAHSPIFWTKMALFVTIALLSIPPTIHYLRLKGTASPDGVVAIPNAAYGRMRALLMAEAVLLGCIPLLATLLTHGYQ
jgi:putative membrane protein